MRFYDKALEDLRSANMRIVSLKGSGLSWQERERGIFMKYANRLACIDSRERTPALL